MAHVHWSIYTMWMTRQRWKNYAISKVWAQRQRTLLLFKIMRHLFSDAPMKIRSCVLLFCLQRESMAVDTHVFRISKKLQWVPQKATRIETQFHLDAWVPAEMKYPRLLFFSLRDDAVSPKCTRYPLHCLLVNHGRQCHYCIANKSGKVGKHPCPLFSSTKREDVKDENSDMENIGQE